MRFHHFDSLRTFTIIAAHGSFSKAADDLNLTKGAVSHQVRKLEDDLGFRLFERLPRGVALTKQGRELFDASRDVLQGLESDIRRLQRSLQDTVVLAVSSYFASRWLSPRLMRFLAQHPEIRLRIQPMIDLQDVGSDTIDLAIRWGAGGWDDNPSELLFLCPAFPVGPRGAIDVIRSKGWCSLPQMQDWEGSTAWRDWHEASGLPYELKMAALVIPDPNVRVQAVIDGQGTALYDDLVQAELDSGDLERLSHCRLEHYGYFLIHLPGSVSNPAAKTLADWLHKECKSLAMDSSE